MNMPLKIFLLRFSVIVILVTYVDIAWSSSIAEGQEPGITVRFDNLSLRQALDEIARLSKRSITYNDNDVERDIKITYTSEKIKVTTILDYVLKNTGLGHRELNGIIVIYKLPPPAKQEKKGSLEGSISSAETGEPLIGASVRLIGTTLGTITDVNGYYQIPEIAPGSYEVTISYLGYETSVIRQLRIEADKATTLNHTLKSSTTELQAVEIIGNKALSGNVVITNEVSLIQDIKRSSLIITGISAEQIARSVDQDAGEVARRLPGVSLMNSFVNIRGMHERYNLTYINGIVAPSSESDRRAFSYDLLPSSMIDKMTVFRSPGPELLADWAGGVIKIETKNASIARQLEFNFSTWYRPESSFHDYYTYQGGKTDWLGKDDGSRALPSGFPEVGAIPAGPLTDPLDYRDRDSYSPEELAANAQWAKRLNNDWNMKRARTGADYRMGLNFYDSWKFGKVRVNNLSSISTTQAKQLITRSFVPYQLADGEGSVSDYSVYNDTVSRVSARWGLLQNLTIYLNPRNTVEVKGIYNRLGTDEVLVRDGYEGLTDFPGMTRNIVYTYKSREIATAQLAGTHVLGEKQGQTLRWSAGYSYSSDDVPAMRGIENTKKYGLALMNSLNSVENSFYYSNTQEKNYTATADYDQKLFANITLRVGGFYEDKQKDMVSRMINLRDISPYYEGDTLDEFNYSLALRPEVFKEDGTGAYITENSTISGQYRVRGKIYAGYGALHIPLFDKRLNIYGGIRYEGQDLLVEVPDSHYLRVTLQSPVLVNDYYPFWLPSVNISWNLNDKLILRAAYGKTLNRPNYRELMPLPVVDPNYAQLKIGNDSLKTAEIHNLDLRFEYYPSEGEFISVGVFYKKLHNAIEAYIRDKATTPSNERVYYTNTPEALVYGVEAEVRKNLGIIPWGPARHFSIIVNGALLKSEVAFSHNVLPNTTGDFSDSRTAKRSLEGTAKYVVNAALYYEHPKWGTKLSLLYNVLGQRLMFAGTSVFPETYELPRHVFDLTLRQRLTKYIEFRAGVQDLLNQSVRLYRDYNRDQKWNPELYNKLPFRDWMFQKYKPGSYYMLGINITL